MPEYSIPGFNTLLVGATGTGKTYSIQTLVKEGIECFVLFTEPGMRTVSNISCEDGLHWHYVKPANPEWKDIIFSAQQINNSFDFESLANKKDWHKKGYGQFIELCTVMNSFTCDRCKKDFGCADEWNTDRCLVVDSLSGISTMSMDLAVGSKPVKSLADWGVAMDNLERFFNRLITGTQCHFIMTAHLEKEANEITGGVTLMAATLGQKLPPKVPINFDDVVQSIRLKTKFTWSTDTINVDLKARNLPIASGMQPSFKLILDAWKEAGGIIQPTEETAIETATGT